MEVSDDDSDSSMTSARTGTTYSTLRDNSPSNSSVIVAHYAGDNTLLRRMVEKKVAPVNSAVEELQKEAKEAKAKLKEARPALIFWSVLLVCGTVLGLVFSLQTYDSCELSAVDSSSIIAELRANVFGQHIAVEMLAAALHEFFAPSNLHPVLALSLHGWTGVGKNFVSGIIIEHLPDALVTKLIVPLHFPHDEEGELYAEQVRDWIESNVTRCHVNVIIIDEMDKASAALTKGIHKAITDLKATTTDGVLVGDLVGSCVGALLGELVGC